MRQAVLTAVLLVTVVFCLPRAALACGVRYTEEQLSENLDEVRQKIELLQSGTDEERREIVRLVYPHFRPLFQKISEEEREAAEEIVGTLRRFLSSEKDDWILSQLLRGLGPSGNDLLRPLFHDALEHPSSNVRWRAVQHFVTHRDSSAAEALEQAWSAEERSWIRLDLALALTCQQSTVHVEKLLEYAETDQPLWQEAAAVSLGRLPVERATERLVRLARNGTTRAQAAALTALSERPLAEATRALLLQASDDPSWEVRQAALRGLARNADEEILDLLLGRVIRGDGERLRWITVDALDEAPPRRVEQALDRIKPFLEGAEQEEAFETLRQEWSWTKEQAESFTTRGEPPKLAESGATRCDLEPLNADPGAPTPLTVTALPPRTTVRCWQAPAIPGGPWRSWRASTGTELQPTDLFDAPDRRWWLAYVAERHTACWFPETELAGPDSVLPGDLVFAASPPGERIEFELSAIELAGAAASSLSGAGLLKIIEPGTELTGVVLITELITDEKLTRLVEAYGDGSAFLDLYLARALGALRARFPRHQGLGELLVRIDEKPPDPVMAYLTVRMQ